MSDRKVARTQRIGLGVVLGLGLLDAWRYLHYQANPDGVSYVDLARALVADGPGALVNGYWSPLYPALIAAGYAVAPPNVETMYSTAHLMSVLPFVAAALAFHRLLTALRRHAGADSQAAGRLLLGVVGWAAFALYIVKGIGLHLITPDLGVAAVAFWVAAEAFALGAAPWPPARWARAGVVLATGYWWKAILFPVGLVWLAAAFVVAWRRRDAWRGPVTGGAVYGILALAWIVPVSLHTGRVTFGETGRLNYLWYVDAAPYVWERCLPPGIADSRAAPFGRMARDSVITGTPLTCAVASPLATVTMPLWDDPSRYYRETHTRLDLEGQRRAVVNNVAALHKELGELGPVLPVSALLLGIAVAIAAWSSRRREAGSGHRAGPAMFGVFLAAPVVFYLLVYVEFRHVAPFVAMAIAAVAAGAARLHGPARRALGALAVVAVIEVAWRLATPTLVAFTLARATILGRAPDRVPVTHLVARELARAGIEPGMRVASIFNAWNAEWAQLAGLRIRAIVPEMTTPVGGVLRTLRDPCVLAAWDSALARHGIAAAVARVPEGIAAPPGFEQLAGTEFRLHRVGVRPKPCATHSTASSSGT